MILLHRAEAAAQPWHEFAAAHNFSAEPAIMETLNWLDKRGSGMLALLLHTGERGECGIVLALVRFVLGLGEGACAGHTDGLHRLGNALAEVLEGGDRGEAASLQHAASPTPAIRLPRGLIAVLPLLDALIVVELDRLITEATPPLEGRVWVRGSYNWWGQIVPRHSTRTLKRVFHRLEACGVVVAIRAADNPRDRTKSYTLDYAHPLLVGQLTPPLAVSTRLAGVDTTALPDGDTVSPPTLTTEAGASLVSIGNSENLALFGLRCLATLATDDVGVRDQDGPTGTVAGADSACSDDGHTEVTQESPSPLLLPDPDEHPTRTETPCLPDKIVTAEAIAADSARGSQTTLPGDPAVGRVARHAHMHHAAGAERDDEGCVGRAEQEVGDREGVAGPDPVGVVAQEGRPGLARRARGAVAAQGGLDGARGDADVQLQEFAPDALRAPQRVFTSEPSDQGDGLRRERRAARPRA